MRRVLAAVLLVWLALPAWAGVDSGILIQTSPLAGFQYHAGRALFPLLAVGDVLSLHREPGNPYDPRAIRVEWRGAMLGYAPRADNIDLARLIDNGAQVRGRIVALRKARDPWKRVLFDVEVITSGTEAVELQPSSSP